MQQKELKEGYYNVEITGVDSATHQGSAKIPPCEVKLIHYIVIGTDIEGTTKIYLTEKLNFVKDKFLESVQARPHMTDWNELVGSTGRAAISTREYQGKDGKTHKAYNEIKAWVKPSQYGKTNKIEYVDEAVEAYKNDSLFKEETKKQEPVDQGLQKTRQQVLTQVLKSLLEGDIEQAVIDLNSIGLNTVKFEDAMREKYVPNAKYYTPDGHPVNPDIDDLPF